MSKSHLLVAAAMLLVSAGAIAQPAAPNPAAGAGAHHPPAAAAPAVPGHGGMMMGGDMGQMMPMMRRMMSQHDMARMDGPMGMMSPARIEGRIAFIKAELKITEAQNSAWTAYAEILRAEAKAMAARRGVMMAEAAPAAAPDRADQRVKRMTDQLEAAKADAGALRSLYAVLDEAQKKTADEVLAPAMGRM